MLEAVGAELLVGHSYGALCSILAAERTDRLRRLAAEHELDIWEGDLPPDPGALRERVAAADGLLSLVTDPVDAELLAACPDLKAIANMAVGTDNIDLEAAAERGIRVGNTPDVLTDATADLAFALLLSLARRIPAGAAQVREGRWKTWEPAGAPARDSSFPARAICWGEVKKLETCPRVASWRETISTQRGWAWPRALTAMPASRSR